METSLLNDCLFSTSQARETSVFHLPHHHMSVLLLETPNLQIQHNKNLKRDRDMVWSILIPKWLFKKRSCLNSVSFPQPQSLLCWANDVTTRLFQEAILKRGCINLRYSYNWAYIIIIKLYLKHIWSRQQSIHPSIQSANKRYWPLNGWEALDCDILFLVEHTFEPVRFFVSDQTDAADVEFFEDLVDVPLHRFKRQVSYVCGERRLRRQLLLLPGTSGGSSTSAGA